ncbi:nucleotidyltransferase domain-containing protein [Sphingomonas koreensis]|nr:nucleotidyltransferase domain-containing protein [Sphingomonas koreensis]
MPRDPLTAMQRGTLLGLLARHVDAIDRVDLFGSRARGDHRPGSDVDLLIHGSMTADRLAMLAAEIDASDLSLDVDLHLAAHLEETRFAELARREARPLFSHEDLIATG